MGPRFFFQSCVLFLEVRVLRADLIIREEGIPLRDRGLKPSFALIGLLGHIDQRVESTEYIFYCKRAILFLSSSKILTPHPLSARQVCPPPQQRWGGGGV